MSAIHLPDPDTKADIELNERAVDPAEDSEEIAAHLSAREEQSQTVSQALRSSPWAIVWLCYGVWSILCCSFDSNAGSLVLGIPRFRQDFGYAFQGDYILPADWQSAFSGGPAATQVVGTFVSGSEKIGRKWMCMVSYVVLMIGITLEVIANITPNPSAVFFAGKAINGLGIGALQITGFIYISECAPVVLRGIFTSIAAVAFCIGTLVLALVLNAFGALDNSWAYKSIFLTQYFVTGIGILFLPFIPETPAWLVMKGRYDSALKSQKRLGSSEEVAKRKIANIKYTLRKAAEESAGVSYAEVFRKTNLRRTVVACMPLTFQAWSGVFWVVGYFVYYCQLAGYSTEMSYKLNITQQVLSTFGNICSWFMIERLGRRFLTLWGMIGLTTMLLLAGGCAAIGTVAGNRATISFILLYCWYYNCTIGATSWVAASEIGTSRLRNKTAGLGLAAQGALATFWNFVLPFMFNPNAGNLQGKVAFIFGGTCVLACIYTYIYHPETKGRSFEEIDEMFFKRIPARKFASYVTEAETRAAEVKLREDESVKRVSATGDDDVV